MNPMDKITLRRNLSKRLSQIKQRCENKNSYDYRRYYGAHGIKNELSLDDLLAMWERDVKPGMKRPVLDRIDPEGNYSLENCRFVPWAENTARARLSVNPPTEKVCRLCEKKFMGVWIHKYCSEECRRKYHGRYRMVDGKIIYIKKA